MSRLKYRESEDDQWTESLYESTNAWSLAEYLAECEYEGQTLCDWEYRVQILCEDGTPRWFTVTGDLSFDAICDD